MTTLSDTDSDAAAEELRRVGYAIVRTTGDEDAVMSAARALGYLVGAQTFGSIHLRATQSRAWLGRHTESLTDGPEPLRYFALACFVPAEQGGATQLYDGSEAASILTGLNPDLCEVRISYRSAHRPEASDHPLIVEYEQHGPVLRFRTACEHNTVLTKPGTLTDTALYSVIEGALSASDETP